MKALEQWMLMLRHNLVVSLKLGQRLLGECAGSVEAWQ